MIFYILGKHCYGPGAGACYECADGFFHLETECI